MKSKLVIYREAILDILGKERTCENVVVRIYQDGKRAISFDEIRRQEILMHEKIMKKRKE